MAGLLRTVAEEISKYNLDVLGLQEVRWNRGATETAGKYTFFYGKGIADHKFHTSFFVHKRII
jgi:mRNA deadenylase 3'-5' endonuclease subunit Ccr4